MPGIAGKRALVRVAGTPVAFTDEPCSTTDDQTYQIDDTTMRYWDRDAAITVEEDTIATAEAYTVNRLLGTITFATVDAGRGAVTVSGQYLPTSVAAGARAYSFSLSRTLLDDTDFDSANDEDGFMSKLAGMLDVQGSIGRRFRVNPYFVDALLAGVPVLLEFYGDRSAAPDLVAWGLLSKEGIQSAIDGTTDTDCEWQGAPDADGNVAAEPA